MERRTKHTLSWAWQVLFSEETTVTVLLHVSAYVYKAIFTWKGNTAFSSASNKETQAVQSVQDNRRTANLFGAAVVDWAVVLLRFGSASEHQWTASGSFVCLHHQTSQSLGCSWGILGNGSPSQLLFFGNLPYALFSAEITKKTVLKKATIGEDIWLTTHEGTY